LGLGKLTVQSALGETLKAEIDITSLSAEEASTLKVRVAPPESYRATGVEYNAVLTTTQVQVARRDGRNVLRVSSDRAVQEPFVDVILELTWSSGRLVREYTLLFDPPSTPRSAAATPGVTTSPQISAAPAASAEPNPAALAAAARAAASAGARPASPEATATRPRTDTAQPRAASQAASSSAAASEYTVKPGDSLSRIAGRVAPAGVSLDQMLVGLYRNNEDAFIDGNMNRLKAGSLLRVPGADALGGISTAEARQLIRAQSADFNAYRQRLSGAAPLIKQDESERQAKGRVQAAVEDRKQSAAPTPDKLTLSKTASADAKLAKTSKDTEKKDSAARVAELTRNVEELKKLSGAAAPAVVSPGSKTAAAPAAVPSPLPMVAPAPAPAPAPTPSAPPVVSPPVPAPAAELPASAPAAEPAVVASKPLPRTLAPAASAPPAPPPQAPEPSLIDELLGSPLVLGLGAALIAGLGAFGLYRVRNRKAQAKADTGFQESRLQPDSFFGATGGQRVDTRDANSGASSMNYSLSQLDAIGDVDPVAEADVYLAYGRDLQAEEILKEALRANPERMAIRLKLLEVYAKRRDTKGFEQLAIQLYAETQGRGEDWAKAQEMGRQIDPENPFYQPGGAPSLPSNGREVHPEPMDASTLPHTVSAGGPLLATEPAGRSAPDTGPVSVFDLDLDLDLDSPAPAPSPIAMDATQALPTTVDQAPMRMDFDLSAQGQATQPGNELEFDMGALDELDGGENTAPAPAHAGDSLDFDLSSITLDLPAAPGTALPGDLGAQIDALLNESAPTAPAAVPDIADLGLDDGDPLLRQLELADEFRQIGDTEGAREVLQELISKTSGALRDKAQAMLSELR